MTGRGSLPPQELLLRISRLLKKEIGPAVAEAYPKTQAFLASVVLEKLAGQLGRETEHASLERRDLDALSAYLEEQLASFEAPGTVARAVSKLREQPDSAALTELVRALYTSREELGNARFEGLLGRVRTVLRARIDRIMEYSA